ncbi:MAG: M20/M25/M40 family metallo-hydrolase, partial [Crocinitomicaceae bacterium]|nr:M20/M25/M40 family metallo-hydrolase [Crocinitomicaceae bacterium]
YVNKGDVRSADFIVQELKDIGVQNFKGKPYTQEYSFNVNSFPYKIEVILGNDSLIAGSDYLVSPISGTAQGDFDLIEINKNNFFTRYGGNVNFKLMDPSQTIFAFNFMDAESKDLKNKISALAYEATKYFPVIIVTNKKQMYSVGRKQSTYPLITIDSSAYHKVDKATLKINNKFITDYKTKNVIGFIPGKKKRKYVVFSAHYDHLGRMGPDTYFPGANDNASGVAMLLSLAKYYMINKPKYSMVFCFFSGEEAGLLGSKYFVSHPYFPLKKVKFVLNIDIMGGAEEGITVVNGTKHEKEYLQMVDINEEYQLIKQLKKRGTTSNSDHYFFSKMGIPAFFIYSMGNVKNYHDIYDTAENTPLNKFDEVQELLELFVQKIK